MVRQSVLHGSSENSELQRHETAIGAGSGNGVCVCGLLAHICRFCVRAGCSMRMPTTRYIHPSLPRSVPPPSLSIKQANHRTRASRVVGVVGRTLAGTRATRDPWGLVPCSPPSSMSDWTVGLRTWDLHSGLREGGGWMGNGEPLEWGNASGQTHRQPFAFRIRLLQRAFFGAFSVALSGRSVATAAAELSRKPSDGWVPGIHWLKNRSQNGPLWLASAPTAPTDWEVAGCQATRAAQSRLRPQRHSTRGASQGEGGKEDGGTWDESSPPPRTPSTEPPTEPHPLSHSRAEPHTLNHQHCHSGGSTALAGAAGRGRG